MNKILSENEQEGKKKPTIKELSIMLGASTDLVQSLEIINNGLVSLDVPVGG